MPKHTLNNKKLHFCFVLFLFIRTFALGSGRNPD